MIYIQSKNNLPHHFDCACALYGAEENVQDFKLVSFEDVSSGKFDQLIKKNLFVGSVEFMREVFNRIGLNDVRLPKNSNRESKIITLEEALEISLSKKIFIKPIEIKLFTGLVLDGFKYSCIEQLPKDTKVLCYDVFPETISSEWRIYVKGNEIYDSRNYSGDFKISPNYDFVQKIIDENLKDFPKAYTIDVGILENKKNVVIEYNDMWAIGNYGMRNDYYLHLLKTRYFEIISYSK